MISAHGEVESERQFQNKLCQCGHTSGESETLFVTRAYAVRRYGLGGLQALNQISIDVASGLIS
jgi:hypothetical protein